MRVVLLALALAAAPATPPLQAPRWTRARMEAATPAPGWSFVYGTRDPAAAPVLQRRATFLATRLYGADSARVLADTLLAAPDAARRSLVLVGGPRANAWTARLAPALPVEFTARGFRWRGAAYEQPDEAIGLAWPNPLSPRAFVVVVAANDEREARTARAWGPGADDWRITRGREVVRSGRFAQSDVAPWRYDPALDRDADRLRGEWERALVVEDGGVRMRAPRGLPWARRARESAEALAGRLEAMGLRAPGHRVCLTLFESIESRGVIRRETRPESFAGDSAEVAALAGRTTPDLWCVAASRLAAFAGREDSRFLVPAAVSCADRFEGETFAASVARLYDGRALPTAEAAATRASGWRSPLVWTPARALLARAAWDAAPGQGGPAVWRRLLDGDPPGTLDSLAARLRVSRAVLARNYQRLAESLAARGRAEAREHRARPWRPADGFERGVCLEHVVGLSGGYGSRAAARTLADLRARGFDAVSLTPFAYLPSLQSPELWPSALGGPAEETDEAVIEAIARARAAGLRVWLKPHLWTRGWVGDLALTPAGWTRFFENYREYALHGAILAEREGCEGYCAGHELVSSTRAAPDRWRRLLGELRGVYSGTLTYSANWDEVAQVPFWDATDVVGVSCYAPLATAPTRDEAALRRGAREALARIRAVASRAGRPLMLTEVGYATAADAAVRPWDESGPPDPAAQRACWAAMIDALDGADDVAGLFVWKWPSAPGEGRDARFSPQGRPAEAVVVEAMRRWAGRPVRAAAAR